MDTNGIFSVPEENLSSLAKKIDHLTKRAVKLGCAPITMSVGESYTKPLVRHGEVVPFMFVTMFPVTIGGTAPSLHGWNFKALIDHDGEENVIRGLGGEIPVRFRTLPAKCEHCKLDRKRVETFLVYSATTDVWTQVGRTCLADFLGHQDPSDVAAMAELLADAMDAGTCAEDMEEGFGGGRGDPRIDWFMTVVAKVVRENGWMPKSKEDEFSGLVASVTLAVGLIFGKEPFKVTDGDRDRAEKAIAWARGLTDAQLTNDYMWNLRACAKRSVVGSKNQGITASILPAYDRVQADLLAAGNSEYVGTVGKRETFILTVCKVIPITSSYGDSYIHVFVDAAGNTLTWKASNNPLETGVTYSVKGTVKAQEIYQKSGVKQTKLSRCKAEKIEKVVV